MNDKVMSQEYYSVLARTIVAVGQDQSQLRMMIYRLARSELRKDLHRRKDISFADVKQQMFALEAAIEQLESDAVSGDTVLLTDSPFEAPQQDATGSSSGALTVRTEHFKSVTAKKSDGEILPPVFDQRVRPWSEPIPAEPAQSGSVPVRAAQPMRAAVWSTVRLLVAVLLGVSLFSLVENRTAPSAVMRWLHRYDAVGGSEPTSRNAINAAQATDRVPTALGDYRDASSTLNLGPQIPNVAAPSSYGVYAVNQGKLIELETLPIRVPDRRVGISALISTPTGAKLADGRLQFIAFQRDLAINAPDHVMVRVVARVMRSLTFDPKGRARIIKMQGSWAVRSKSYEMEVAPVRGNPEMIIIRPAKANFSFSPGRYALVLSRKAYDFSVTGPINDPAQCLERTDAVNMPVYSECRSP